MNLSQVYKSQIQTAEKAIEDLLERRKKGRIPDDEFYGKIDMWDDRIHEAIFKLKIISNEKANIKTK